MRRIRNFIRNNRSTVVYMVIQDDDRNTMEVWECDASTNVLRHVETKAFTATTSGRNRTQDSAKALAIALSKGREPAAAR